MVVGAPAAAPRAACAGAAGIGVVGWAAGVDMTDCADGVGDEGNCPAGSCAPALSAISRKGATIHLQVRMTLILSHYPYVSSISLLNMPVGTAHVRSPWNPPPNHCAKLA